MLAINVEPFIAIFFFTISKCYHKSAYKLQGRRLRGKSTGKRILKLVQTLSFLIREILSPQGKEKEEDYEKPGKRISRPEQTLRCLIREIINL